MQLLCQHHSYRSASSRYSIDLEALSLAYFRKETFHLRSMERVSEDQNLPRKAPRLVYSPVLEKKPPKPKPVLEYHLVEQKITSAITDFKAGKYTSLAAAGRAHGVTERAGYFRLRARAAGRASKSDRFKNGSQRLSPEQEIILCQFVDSLEDIRALHRKIGEKAYSMLCEDLTAEDPLPAPLGKQWPARFLERHPGIMARRPKPLTSRKCGEPDDETSLSIPREEAHTSETTNEEPLLLVDCQRFLERSTDADETLGQISSSCTAPAASPNVLIATGGTSSLDRHVPTAMFSDRPPAGSSTTISFLSAVKSSLAEHRMTFSTRLT
ncbi:hypothetical protein M436DRAFT_63901 [Aureobasidium namibiae CBS 147.97]|uniref:HTH CENPB-type domain-containing protein n=1 Tax=Aureobasidium namibiae CBS 147.97 TaxID=1043004 RepID=A0A074WPX9_9PEZI|nr:uncharacterized protein M436DRAFT_63901 [Aureobasidium namibiae CBS 147.97]KEQ73624.1 hypothetical protein M436DRAFT_63901 [Aureobasidium namibiae CBS 147.97]